MIRKKCVRTGMKQVYEIVNQIEIQKDDINLQNTQCKYDTKTVILLYSEKGRNYKLTKRSNA